MAYRGGALTLVVAIAVCSTAAAATDGTSAQKTSPINAPHRVQVLRILETKHAVPAGTKVLSKSKTLASSRKVTRHRPLLAHHLAPATSANVAKSTDRPPLAVKQAAKADINPVPAPLAVENGPTATTRNAADEMAHTTTPIHALMIKTQQHAEPREPGQILPGATPIASSDFRTTDSQVAARWPSASEIFTPLAPTYQHASFQIQQ
jgi:hypothetical protein